jgi:hypothetical protein
MIKWERLKSEGFDIYRAKVPGGWLVWATAGGGEVGMIFYPDPDHKWNGSSLP